MPQGNIPSRFGILCIFPDLSSVEMFSKNQFFLCLPRKESIEALMADLSFSSEPLPSWTPREE